MDRRLTVLYDADCGICRKARRWLSRQPQLVPLDFVAAGSPKARRLFPGLDPVKTLALLHVVDERGNVYAGAKAWVLCLWALDEYRGWAVRLSGKDSYERAERFVRWISSRRHTIGGKLHAR